jgi:hypothetical protein
MLVAITVGGDIIVLTLFAMNLGIARNMCAGETFDPAAFFLDIALIIVAFVMGFIIGWFLIGCLYVPYAKHLILPVGFMIYLTCDYILAVSEEDAAYPVGIDSLLVMIAAGFVCVNSAPHDKVEELLDYLKKFAKYVFIPFFTVVGLNINLPVLVNSFGFSFLAVCMRAFCMQLGTLTGGYYAKLSREHSCLLWIGLIPQAGVSLGLAGVIAQEFPETFGSDFQSTMIGIILINQIIGPIGAKYLLKKVQEDGKGEGQLPTTGGMRFVMDMDKPKPRMQTQTQDDFDSEEGVKVLTALPRDINPVSTEEATDAVATQLLDFLVEKPMNLVPDALLPTYQAQTMNVETKYVSDDTHNPLFDFFGVLNHNQSAPGSYKAEEQNGVEITNQQIPQRDFDDDGEEDGGEEEEEGNTEKF